MQYPLISEYVQAIIDSESNLDQLNSLRPVLDDHDEPYRTSGAFAVVFKMKDEDSGKYYALKCFTEEQDNREDSYRMITDELQDIISPYITKVQYIENELFVDSNCTDETEFPVLLMDWIEGDTMENYVAQNYQDEYLMKKLYHQFCMMASWLTTQTFAHGDIKPDNILVRSDGYLTLVDYDGMYVPEMKGQCSPTIGTRDFTHPLRTATDFDKSIDDFALASIALSLKAISIDSLLLDNYGAPDRLLFSYDDYFKPASSPIFTALCAYLYDEELCQLFGNFLIALSSKSMRFTRENDEEYSGSRNADNEKSGYGILKKIDGTIYAGGWRLDMRSGMGLESGTTREIYAGQWRTNIQEGIGTKIFEDGIIYSGQWKNGKRNGLGTIFYPNGLSCTAQFENDLITSSSVTWALKDNTILIGQFSEKGPTGNCKRITLSGKFEEEIWLNGLKQKK